MTPEIETLLNSLKSTHLKYLESLKNFNTQEDIDFHTNESNQRFNQLLKEIEERNFDVVLIKDDGMKGSGVRESVVS